MSKKQERKKKILKEEKRKRRNRIIVFSTLIVGIITIGIMVYLDYKEDKRILNVKIGEVENFSMKALGTDMSIIWYLVPDSIPKRQIDMLIPFSISNEYPKPITNIIADIETPLNVKSGINTSDIPYTLKKDQLYRYFENPRFQTEETNPVEWNEITNQGKSQAFIDLKDRKEVIRYVISELNPNMYFPTNERLWGYKHPDANRRSDYYLDQFNYKITVTHSLNKKPFLGDFHVAVLSINSFDDFVTNLEKTGKLPMSISRYDKKYKEYNLKEGVVIIPRYLWFEEEQRWVVDDSSIEIKHIKYVDETFFKKRRLIIYDENGKVSQKIIFPRLSKEQKQQFEKNRKDQAQLIEQYKN